MREIKFRAQVINSVNEMYNGLWGYGYIVEVMGVPSSSYFLEQLSDWGLNMKNEVDPNSIGEFTGLKDKNSKEIYEGDIVIGSSTPFSIKGTVVFYNGSFQINTDTKRVDAVVPLADIHFGAKFIEVIGNIYENPELTENK